MFNFVSFVLAVECYIVCLGPYVEVGSSLRAQHSTMDTRPLITDSLVCMSRRKAHTVIVSNQNQTFLIDESSTVLLSLVICSVMEGFVRRYNFLQCKSEGKVSNKDHFFLERVCLPFSIAFAMCAR